MGWPFFLPFGKHRFPCILSIVRGIIVSFGGEMKSKTSYAILIFAFTLLLVACGGGTDTESAIATGIAQTQQISALETAAAGGAPAPDQGDAPADHDQRHLPTSESRSTSMPRCRPDESAALEGEPAAALF